MPESRKKSPNGYAQGMEVDSMRITISKLREWVLLLTIFLIPIDSAVFYQYNNRPLFVVPLTICIALTFLTLIEQRKKLEFHTFIEGKNVLWFILPMLLYIFYDMPAFFSSMNSSIPVLDSKKMPSLGFIYLW